MIHFYTWQKYKNEKWAKRYNRGDAYKQGSGKAMNQITQSRDYQLIIRLFVNRIFIFSKF